MMLRLWPEFQVIGEASDGLEAVRKAGELKPDLILLDTSLPKLNGIETARRTRELTPHSKILFVSEESSPELVCEALLLGAVGYVLKAEIASDLIPALSAVLAGNRFVSRNLMS
jgi:DNA-binding NarL/FixJ family response regulator